MFSSAGDALALALSSEHPVGMPSHRRHDRVRQEHGGSARHHRLLDRAEVGQGCTDRDKLLSCAIGSQFRSAGTVATAPSRRRPDSFPTPSRDQWSQPSLTIAEAARLCEVSASTIRRYLAAGRFPTAHQQPTPPRPARGMAHPDPGAAGSRPATTPGPPTRPSTEGRAFESPNRRPAWC